MSRLSSRIFRIYILCGFAMSIGWGIRGNYGHEHGAMMAGVLGTLAAVIALGRPDWLSRAPLFALFGGLGWAFGGSISYMIVISYTHSGHSPSVLYGFTMLFITGFLWGSFGGAGATLPAVWDKRRLAGLMGVFAIFYVLLIFHDFTYDALNIWAGKLLGPTFISKLPLYDVSEPLNWYDTDWTTALLGVLTFGLIHLFKPKLREHTRLPFYMAVGWWAGFLVLTVLLNLRMTPPRGDNWAGCVGMLGALYVWTLRAKEPNIRLSTTICGVIGGFGFAGAALIKLLWMKTGMTTNWHSVLEQSYGFINGLGIAAMMMALNRTVKSTPEHEQSPRGLNGIAAFVVLLGYTCLNLRKNAEDWVKAKAMAPTLYWFQVITWFNIAWFLFAVLGLLLLRQHLRRPLEIVPTSSKGRAQGLFLAFLAMMVIGNFERAVVGFAEQRLITEGVILVNALIATFLTITAFEGLPLLESGTGSVETVMKYWVRRGALASVLFIVGCWGTIRLVYGDAFAGNSRLHIRFGPNNTNAPKPKTKPVGSP